MALTPEEYKQSLQRRAQGNSGQECRICIFGHGKPPSPRSCEADGKLHQQNDWCHHFIHCHRPRWP